MSDSKTLLRSSIISIIIVVVGLFLLCVSRAPQINVDEQLVETETAGTDSEDMSDHEFLSLLESADDEISSEQQSDQNSGESNKTTSESILLGGTNQETSTEDDELADLFNLLNLGEDEIGQTGSDSYSDNTVSEQGTSTDSESDELERLLFDSGSSNTSSESTNQEEIVELNDEVQRLEDISRQKDVEITELNQTIQDYDQQIAQLENTNYAPGGGNEYASFENPAYDDTQDRGDESYSVSEYQSLYDTALNLFYNRQYRESINSFRRLMENFPRNSLSDNCQYWIGECEYALGKYSQAIVEFQKVFSYDATDKWDDAQLMMALANMRLGQNIQAKNDFSWFMALFESSEYYQKAQYYYDGL